MAPKLLRLIPLIVQALLWAQKAPPPPVEEVLPKQAPTQPIPFSHKQHTAQGIKCADCHPKGIPAKKQKVALATAPVM